MSTMTTSPKESIPAQNAYSEAKEKVETGLRIFETREPINFDNVRQQASEFFALCRATTNLIKAIQIEARDTEQTPELNPTAIEDLQKRTREGIAMLKLFGATTNILEVEILEILKAFNFPQSLFQISEKMRLKYISNEFIHIGMDEETNRKSLPIHYLVEYLHDLIYAGRNYISTISERIQTLQEIDEDLEEVKNSS